MAVRTWVGRFTVVDGHVHEEGAWLGSLIRQHPDEEPDELYVLVEPASGASRDYTTQLVDVVARLYQRDALSLTGALVRSLRAAHEHLREWNEKSLKEHRIGAGATCLSLRGTEAYIAQAGPSLAYVRRASGEFLRVRAEGQTFDDAIGIGERFEPKLTRVELGPGDLVLIASTQLDAIAPPDHIQRILARGADEALPELYLLARDAPDFALVLLSCFEEESQAPEFLTRDGGTPDVIEQAEHAASSAAEAIGNTVSAPEPVGVGAEPARMELAAGEFELPSRPIQDQVREITQTAAPPPSANVRLRGDSATPRYKRTTGAGAVSQVRVPKLLVVALVALAALGFLLWRELPGSVKENREERFATLVSQARESNARAQATSDPGAKRELLDDAQAKLADAAKIHADSGEVTALKADVAAALGVLDAVYEIKDITPVVDLSQQVTGALSVTNAVVGGGNAFFLDAKGHRVLRVPVDGSAPPDTILQEGGLAGVVTAARPAQIAWSEQTQALLILDDRRQAFAYFPDKGALPLVVRGADGLGSLDAIAASGGNLYLLDVKSNQVWRYLPGQGGFDSERTGLLDAVSLKDATELAVGQDIYVLDSRLGVRRFVGKTETAFPLAGIDTPLVSPASLAVLPGSNRIVLADRGNKRIIVASPEGAFLRQIVSPAFTDLRAVQVDEGQGVLYVLNGDSLLRAPFPP
ncbi:MAG TPA: hypothetical protein VFC53_09185 [Dehalococcoidia bacterium]|nr:hypothetical protein [Dehalococcoidia bacterium]